MSTENFAEIVGSVRETRPLVHCITNYVTVNDCANALLAAGGAPVMADDAREAARIASISNAVVINIGTLNRRTIRSMFIAGKRAMRLGIPTVLDPVGAGASNLRTHTALRLAGKIPFTVIRGNVSEIKTLHGVNGNTRGVDAADDGATPGATEGIASTAALARSLSRGTGAIVVVTGAVDVISDGARSFAVRNGHPAMARITGSGCMLSAVVGAFVGAAKRSKRAAEPSAENDGNLTDATVAAVAAMGIAGEQAAADLDALASLGLPSGTGSFRARLIDRLALMDEDVFSRGARIERLA